MPGYQMDRSVFLWAQDGQAMSKLQSISALQTVVRNVSDKVGRPWIESTFNAIKLGPRQFPDVWNQAVLAARILGLPKMPDVYISGDQMWNTYTYGTENSSFIVLGTSHLINFAGDELLFVLAREMGHCRAGHALWNTVLRFVAGDVSVHTGLLSNGLINAINPSKLIQGAIDLPLMAWSRQSDITADRAGLMAVGDEALVRRVLLAWSIRSARLLQQVNIEEWLKQESASDDSMTKFSEMTTSSSMYTTRRLRLLGQAAHETELMRWSQSIQPVRKKLAPVPTQAMPGLGVGTVKAVKAGSGGRCGGWRGGGSSGWSARPAVQRQVGAAVVGMRSVRRRKRTPCRPQAGAGNGGEAGGCARAHGLDPRDLQQVPGRDADSACGTAGQDGVECALPAMPHRGHFAAESGDTGGGCSRGSGCATMATPASAATKPVAADGDGEWCSDKDGSLRRRLVSGDSAKKLPTPPAKASGASRKSVTPPAHAGGKK